MVNLRKKGYKLNIYIIIVVVDYFNLRKILKPKYIKHPYYYHQLFYVTFHSTSYILRLLKATVTLQKRFGAKKSSNRI